MCFNSLSCENLEHYYMLLCCCLPHGCSHSYTWGDVAKCSARILAIIAIILMLCSILSIITLPIEIPTTLNTHNSHLILFIHEKSDTTGSLTTRLIILCPISPSLGYQHSISPSEMTLSIILLHDSIIKIVLSTTTYHIYFLKNISIAISRKYLSKWSSLLDIKHFESM